MADELMTLDDMAGGKLDLKTIAIYTSGDENVVNEPRLAPGVNVGSLAALNKHVKDKVDLQIATLPAGHKGYKTLVDAQAAQSTLAANTIVEVTNDSDSAKNGVYIWDGATLTKSTYDVKAAAVVESNKYTDNRLPAFSNPNYMPVIVDSNSQSPLWIENGEVGFASITNASAVNVKTKFGLVNAVVSSLIPILADKNGDIPLWIEGGKLNFADIADNAVAKISEKIVVSSPVTIKTNNVTSAAYPILSDRASLRQFIAKAAKLKSGLTQQLRVLITGDSWTEHVTITNELTTLLRTNYGESGTGWINIAPENNQLDGVSVAKSGTWAISDLNNVASMPYSSAPDGFSADSSTAGSTITISNITKADTVTVFYGKTTGSFSYSVNGGAATTVTVDSTGATTQSTTINVSGTSNIVITVLSGTVSIFGFHARKSGSGIEVTKMGNGSCTGKDFSKISPTTQSNMISYLMPDVVIIILGTNDYRLSGNTVDTYKAGISAMIDGYRTNNLNCGIILVAPAQSNAGAVTPLSSYRDAVYDLAQSKKAEFYNMYDDWDTWAIENENGQWNDGLHVSKSGAYRLARRIYKNLLEI